MNLYCESCGRFVEAAPCPHCGSDAVRSPQPRDPCFLTEQGYVQATILADILAQNGIPFMTKMRSIKGCGTILMSNRLFFVAHQNLEAAQAVVNELFYTHEEDRAGSEPVEGMLKEESPLLTPEEIDTLDGCVPEKMNRAELTAFKAKLQATLKEMKIQERLCKERINVLRDMIDETDYAIDDLPS